MKTKGKWKRIAALALSVVTVMTGVSGCSEQVSYKDDITPYIKTMDYHEGFTILQLTDIHWSGGSQIGDDEYGSKSYIKKVVAEAEKHAGHIDLIEVTGDTFMLANKSAVNSFIDMMTEIGIPYAMTWGNHDRESTYNPNWISEQFLEAPNSLYTEVDNDDVHGRSNYVINLTDGGKTCWQIVHLDSGASYREGAGDMSLTYDYMRQDQFDWLGAVHADAGADVPAICYYHIVQSENQMAWDAIRAGSTEYKNKFFKLEGLAASKHAGSTLEVFAANNVKAAFMGHDHAVDWTFTTPDGIIYGLGVKTGTELYCGTVPAGYEGAGITVTEDFDLIGASLVTLTDTEGALKLEHLYLNERDGGDFVMWVEY